MPKRSLRDIERIFGHVEGVKKLSDRVVGIGPFGVGLDGLLTWIPAVGTAYTLGAAAWLLVLARRSKASSATMAKMCGYLGLDASATVIGEVIPFAPDVIDFFFPGHLMAARALQAEMERTHFVEGTQAEAEAAGAHEGHAAHVRDHPTLKRLIYLDD